jgi:hypothetical protein
MDRRFISAFAAAFGVAVIFAAITVIRHLSH